MNETVPGIDAEFRSNVVKSSALPKLDGILHFSRIIVWLAWLVIVTGITFMIAAPHLAPFPPNEIHLADSFSGPNSTYFLGTDTVGRDIFSRIIYGSRVSLLAGLLGTILAVLIGATVGIASGVIRGLSSMLIQSVMDVLQAIPGVILAMFLVIALGPSTYSVTLAVGVTLAPRINRVVRAASLEAAESNYVQAAKSVGASNARIMFYHVLPNVAAPIIVMFSLTIGSTILIVASLDFLGLGVTPPTATWGGMLGDNTRTAFLTVPTLAVFPGLAISLTVWAFNMAGDDLRDRLDPALRGR